MKPSQKSIAIIGNQGFSLLNFRGELIEDLVQRGHTVYAVAPGMTHEIQNSLRQIGAAPVELPLARAGTNVFADVLAFARLFKTLRRLAPSVVLAYAVKPSIYGTVAAALAGIAERYAMIEGLGYVFTKRPEEGIKKRTLRRVVTGLFRLGLRKADNVFFLNNEDISEFTARGLLMPGQAKNIGGIGVDLERWKATKPVRDPVTFLFVGRLLVDKGVLDFVAAARSVKARHPDARFILVGGTDENPESVSREQVHSWVAEGIIEWPGHVQVETWIEQCSVFVLPSYYREGVPRSTQEAMAMGRAVITTDSVGCRDTVEDGRNGFLVPVRDPNALANKMIEFIRRPDLIVSMGDESRKMAEERFDVRKVNRTIMDVMKV